MNGMIIMQKLGKIKIGKYLGAVNYQNCSTCPFGIILFVSLLHDSVFTVQTEKVMINIAAHMLS